MVSHFLWQSALLSDKQMQSIECITQMVYSSVNLYHLHHLQYGTYSPITMILDTSYLYKSDSHCRRQNTCSWDNCAKTTNQLNSNKQKTCHSSASLAMKTNMGLCQIQGRTDQLPISKQIRKSTPDHIHLLWNTMTTTITNYIPRIKCQTLLKWNISALKTKSWCKLCRLSKKHHPVC